MEVLRGLAVFALGFEADFLVALGLAEVSLDSLDSFAAFFVAGFLEEEAVLAVAVFCYDQRDHSQRTVLAVLHTLAAGLSASFFASFRGPEGPVTRQRRKRKHDVNHRDRDRQIDAQC